VILPIYWPSPGSSGLRNLSTPQGNSEKLPLSRRITQAEALKESSQCKNHIKFLNEADEVPKLGNGLELVSGKLNPSARTKLGLPSNEMKNELFSMADYDSPVYDVSSIILPRTKAGRGVFAMNTRPHENETRLCVFVAFYFLQDEPQGVENLKTAVNDYQAYSEGESAGVYCLE